MERIDIIKQKLLEMDIEYDSLKDFIQKYLIEIENIIYLKEQAQIEAIALFKNSTYSVSSIAETLNYSRTTFYNHNQILKKYIEHSITISNKNNPYNAIDEIKESRKILQEQISLMENRDIDFEILKHEKSLLDNKISEQDKEITRLKARVHELSSELQKIKAAPKKHENNISKLRN